jgi:outer membrane receptor protein involved in Fe transport
MGLERTYLGEGRGQSVVSTAWQKPLLVRDLVVTVRCLTRVLGPQFEDDENTLRLREAIVVDLGLSYRLEKHTELFISADNIGNAQVVTNRNVDGILYLGTPQMFTSGLRLSW